MRDGPDASIDGLFLNSPFFEFNVPWLMRRPPLDGHRPHWAPPPRRTGSSVRAWTSLYGQSMHADHNGASGPTTWPGSRSRGSRSTRRLARRDPLAAHRQLRAGLDIPAPVLVACSTRTFRGSKWHEDSMTDSVLDVEHIARYAPRLGQHVTLVRFDGGMHDLTLSGPSRASRPSPKWAAGSTRS